MGKLPSFLKLLIGLLSLIIIASCNAQATPRVPERDPLTITQSEAEQLLQLAVQYAQARDQDKLCGLTGDPQDSVCLDFLREGGGWAAVPPNPPKVVRSFVRPNVPMPNGSRMQGGRVLVLEGVDGLGNAYEREFMVTYPGGLQEGIPGPLGTGVVVAIPVYWAALPINNNIPAVGTDGVMRETVVAIPATATPTP
jgi:hypothetical protein